jgi:predicted metal-dependent enzyme (double-stranded beta helix superfamily)
VFAVPPNTVVPAGVARLAAHPVRIAKDYATNRERWRHLLRYDPDRRWHGLLARDGDHEVWLLSWLPGQHTELHDHSGAIGAFTVVSGTLTERVVRRDQPVEVLHEVTAGQARVFGPDYVHHVRNEGPDPAISVHVYRPGRREMRRYRLDPVHGPIRQG